MFRKNQTNGPAPFRDLIFWYERDSGCIAIEADIFTDPDVVPARVADMLTSGLGWIWESWREGPASENWRARNLPRVRELTKLAQQNVDTLIEDFSEATVDGEGRTVWLFGAHIDAIDSLMDEEKRLEALQAFAKGERSPLRIVVFQIEDDREARVFVDHHPAPAIQGVLERWGIAPPIGTKSSYKNLGVMTLESLCGLEVMP